MSGQYDLAAGGGAGSAAFAITGVGATFFGGGGSVGAGGITGPGA